jgi:hypothetical protein
MFFIFNAKKYFRLKAKNPVNKEFANEIITINLHRHKYKPTNVITAASWKMNKDNTF